MTKFVCARNDKVKVLSFLGLLLFQLALDFVMYNAA